MAVMIDWVTVRVPCTMREPINGGCVVAVKPSGRSNGPLTGGYRSKGRTQRLSACGAAGRCWRSAGTPQSSSKGITYLVRVM